MPDVVDDPAWLIATSGFCSSLNVVMKERDIEASETEGDTKAHFIADIEFNYYPTSHTTWRTPHVISWLDFGSRVYLRPQWELARSLAERRLLAERE